MNLAIFDYDNTLSKGYSKYELGFALEDAGMIQKGFKQEVEELESNYLSGQFNYNEKFLKDKVIFKKYFTGLKRTELIRFIKDDFDLEGLLFDWSKDLISELHKRDFIVVVISGCWDFIIEEAQEILDFDTFYASEFIVKENILTNDFQQIITHEMKNDISKKLLNNVDISIGLGDSISDFEILEKATFPFLITTNQEAIDLSKGKNFVLVNESNAKDEILKVLDKK